MPSPVTQSSFPGLDLRDDPQETQGAVDLLNVDFDQAGRLRSRGGYTAPMSGLTGHIVDAWPYFREQQAGYYVVVEYLGGTVTARMYGIGGTASTTQVLGGYPNTFARFGSPSAQRLYIANTVDTVWRLDNTTFSQPAGMPKCQHVAVTPWDNRLVAANVSQIPTGAASTASASLVHFSDAGAPETWSANSYVNLLPGDGEAISAVVAWHDKVFVFKQTKFFVFWSTSTDSTGQPIFNYRTVLSNGAFSSATVQSACAGPDGVYFVGPGGIYKTTGGIAQLVSQPIWPYLSYRTLPNFQQSLSLASGDVFSASRISCVGRRIYLHPSVRFSGNTDNSKSVTFVYDIDLNAWMVWDLKTVMALPSSTDQLRAATDENLVIFAENTGKRLVQHGPEVADDAGTAIVSRYRTGFNDFGTPDAEKWVRELILSGTGTVNVKTAVNDAATLGAAQSVTLGTSPAVGQGRDRRGFRGRNASVEIGASVPWSLSHLTYQVQGQRASGVRSA